MKTNDTNKLKWVFFGTSVFSVIVLDELKAAGFLPELVVTAEDKPKGRKLILTPPEVKTWTQQNNIPFVQLKTLRKPESIEVIKSHGPFDVFIVASYGKLLPQEILDMPKHKTLNVHPSLLPKLRGASPIKSAILTENETGVTIMRLDVEMDHGPILAQKKVLSWNGSGVPYAEDLEKILANEGRKLLAEVLPNWILGKIKEVEQDHSLATICGKIEKENGELDLSSPAETNLRKIRAFNIWPTAYFFKNNKRIIVRRAHIENNELILDRVIPEGKKEMSYSDFLKGQK